MDQDLDELVTPKAVAGLSLPVLAMPKNANELQAAHNEAIALAQILTDGGPVVPLSGNIGFNDGSYLCAALKSCVPRVKSSH